MCAPLGSSRLLLCVGFREAPLHDDGTTTSPQRSRLARAYGATPQETESMDGWWGVFRAANSPESCIGAATHLSSRGAFKGNNV